MGDSKITCPKCKTGFIFHEKYSESSPLEDISCINCGWRDTIFIKGKENRARVDFLKKIGWSEKEIDENEMSILEKLIYQYYPIFQRFSHSVVSIDGGQSRSGNGGKKKKEKKQVYDPFLQFQT